MTAQRIARAATCVLLLLVPAVVSAELRFTRLDLGPDGRLLFETEVKAPGYGTYRTLFEKPLPDELALLPPARPGEGAVELERAVHAATRLSFFPEQLQLLRDPDRIQLRNRFGTVRSDREPDRFHVVETLDRFPEDGTTLPAGRLQDAAFSSDGRYAVQLEPTSPGHGRLVLTEVETGERAEVATQVERRPGTQPANWSPRGDAFVYARGGSLYLFSIRHHESGREFAESYRRIGPGRTANVRWTPDSRLLYLSGTVLYRLRTESFFTRSLYQTYLTVGRAIGRLPHRFNPQFDRFWVSPAGDEILVTRDERAVSLYQLTHDGGASPGAGAAGGRSFVPAAEEPVPSLTLAPNERVHRVLWAPDGRITLLAGARQKRVYRLPPADEERARRQFERVEIPGLRDAALAPQGRRIALITGRSVMVRDHRNWDEITRFVHYEPLHLDWLDDNRVVVSGRYLTEKLRVAEREQRFLAFSQAERFGFELENEDDVLLQSRYALRRLEPLERENGAPRVRSEAVDRFAVHSPRTSDERVRVYTERFTSGRYHNRLMARHLRSLRTSELLPLPEPGYEPFPERDEPVSFTRFNHGSRVRAREVAFVFNAIESSVGLDHVLETLAEYGIAATFFINGDFMRREPESTRRITASGHEIGSLFYTYFDFSRSRFDIDAHFIQRGLARTEDQYHAVTGEELAPLWHAPYYFSNPTIVNAGAEIGYTYVGRDVDSLDWVPARSKSGIPRLYRPSADLVDRIIDRKQPGSIVAMTIGTPNEGERDGGREDYLFEYLELVIENLLERGYRIAPVSALIERAR